MDYSKKEFTKACKKDDLDTMRKIVLSGYFNKYHKPNNIINDGLCEAIENDAFEIMRYLLTSEELPVKANVRANGNRPLILALEKKEVKYLEYICSSPELEIHASYIENDDRNNSLTIAYPFLSACTTGTVDAVKFLLTSPKLKKHVPIEIHDGQGETGLFRACQNGRLDIVKYLLTDPELPVKAKLTKNCISRACSKGHIDVLRFLIFSPDIKHETNIEEMADTFFQFACQQNNLEMVKFLAEECKFKMTPARDFSSSAFEYAALRADNELFSYILYNMNYIPTEEEVEKMKKYKNPRGIPLEVSLEKRELLRNLEKDLLPGNSPVKKIKI